MALRSRRPLVSVIVGVFLGFTAASWLVVPRVVETSVKNRRSSVCTYYSNARAQAKVSDTAHSTSSTNGRRKQLQPLFSSQEGSDEGEEELYRTGNSSDAAGPIPPANSFLYVGVMTAQKYLASRAVAAYRTWTPSIPGRVEFFSSEGSERVPLPIPVPVISLTGVDDSYPPQKKSFMMLKYMHDHYLDKYEWFMRADDDVYIRGEKLESFLRSLNSSKPLYLGQTGLGTTEELGKLALEPGENFCMGGPGMIFSREVLRRMVPHIGSCLREMYTTHEDVEIGRCVRRFGGTQCVWSYED
ncbi:chondroitin sulfate synthase 3 [Danio rerio]|uniref:N-acetylgalactosaminyl-proteoglycan 3-beta-glucuronosyltransferase n=1 Tax=Danio rerio TaxID=7955 RepID=A4IG33_DANRE|nr:chondroitin sulfate synthase 3 [Danio rerio]AAI34907.1 Si:xx-bac7cse.2 protein [Danio rerio]|eukprot:NP_001082817.1 chondroitin sulfate synthase 3 [Danio rerio]